MLWSESKGQYAQFLPTKSSPPHHSVSKNHKNGVVQRLSMAMCYTFGFWQTANVHK